MTFHCVKGTGDAYPPEQAIISAIENRLKKTARYHGFVETAPPALEQLKLLTAKSGSEITDQLWVLKKRSAEKVGLRFDLTVGMTRMFAQRQRELQKPVKWFSSGSMWRYEAPQKGRQREFSQLSVELFGSDKPYADSETIRLLIACLESLGLTPDDFFIRINNRKMLEGFIKQIAPKADFEKIVRVVDKRDKIQDDVFKIELEKCGLAKAQIKDIMRLVSLKGEPKKVIKTLTGNRKLPLLVKQGIAELSAVIADLPSEFLVLDMSLARGLAYYTGIVFEAFDALGKFRAIAGGGRYDNLVELLGGEATPACGFALGYCTLLLLLQDRGKLPKVSLGPDYYIAPVDEGVRSKALEIASKLRARCAVDIDITGRKLGKQIEYASGIGAKKVMIVGEKDLKQGKVTVRELKSGKEQKIPLGNF